MAGLGQAPKLPIVSIVIPVRNEEANIGACLDSVVRQTYPADRLEILVVDGRSQDDTRKLVEHRVREDARIRLLDNPLISTAEGLNVGITNSLGEVITFVGGHTRVQNDYVERGVDALRATGAWAVGGRCERLGKTPTQQAIALATSSPLGVGDSRHNFVAAAGEVETVFPGMWPRWVFDRVGLFDPEMIRNEDNEFSYRIRRSGGRIWLDPAISVEYVPRASFRALFKQYRLYGFGKVRVARKHRGSLRPRSLVPPMWVAFVIASIPSFVLVSRLRLPILAVVATYFGLMAIGAARLAATPAEASRVLWAFVTVHAAYGVGFIEGLVEQVVGSHRGRGA